MTESTWESVRSTGMEVPVDRPLHEMTAELVSMLGDPEPRVREELAYPVLTSWLQRGVYDDLLSGLGDGIVSGLGFGLGRDGDSSVIRRSYSALMLAEIVGRDNDRHLVEASSVLAWGDAATSWYVREFDHRGWIAEMGWAHAIAHGADLLAALARSRHFGALELTVLLDVIADRVLAPTAYTWRHGEDDRLAFAVMTLLHRNSLDTTLVEPWLARLGAGLQPPPTRGHLEIEWPTTEARNTSAFLRALHLQLALGVQGRSDLRGDAELFAEQPTDRADLLLAVLDQIRAESPWLYRPTSRTPVP
ncbi:DUF2785 domain-containing protein [Aeromicrobium sp. Leaf350]|uniref:DUF2785 domain-containing protein n=1 Tax=Aeromicrobium sp. Leaf350 TaxID=2876565 RepID=UPI001E2EDCE7|nr:DUF2785 domain-containing protein [Aeromicrobium sp. Leaf350]